MEQVFTEQTGAQPIEIRSMPSRKPEVEPEVKHWASDQAKREELNRIRNRLGLATHEVFSALGDVNGLGGYTGSYAEAIQDLRDYMERRSRVLIDQCEATPVVHSEALVTMFSTRPIVGPSGRLYNVTARNGATADDIVLTVMEFERALDILSNHGYKEAT